MNALTDIRNLFKLIRKNKAIKDKLLEDANSLLKLMKKIVKNPKEITMRSRI